MKKFMVSIGIIFTLACATIIISGPKTVVIKQAHTQQQTETPCITQEQGSFWTDKIFGFMDKLQQESNRGYYHMPQYEDAKERVESIKRTDMEKRAEDGYGLHSNVQASIPYATENDEAN